MNLEQLSEQNIKHGEEIAALRESLKSAHKRLDENDRVTEGIHKLASNMEALTIQIKILAEGQRSQGERIGALEREPADKWKDAVKQVVGLVIAAVAGVLFSKFM